MGEKERSVLVTGSEGFVGKLVCEALRNNGRTVIPYDIVNGDDIFDKGNLAGKMYGVDTVIHLAAHAHRHSVFLMWNRNIAKEPLTPQEVEAEKEEFIRLNAEGTKSVFDQADLTKVRRFIYASSGAVYGFESGFETPPGTIRTTDVPDLKDLNLHPYPRSKLLAEKYLKLVAGALNELGSCPEIVILRVNWIQHEQFGYGRSGPEWKGATCSIERLTRGFVNAIDARIQESPVVLDLIERNDAWEGSILASDILFGGS